MTKVKCATPGCPCWISDPCFKTRALFQIRTDLLERLAEEPANKLVPASINHLDALIENELGFQDIQAHHLLFRNSELTSGVFHLFTLICMLGHKNQYSIRC